MDINLKKKENETNKPEEKILEISSNKVTQQKLIQDLAVEQTKFEKTEKESKENVNNLDDIE